MLKSVHDSHIALNDGVIVQVDEKRRQADLARQQYEQMMDEQR